MIKCVHISLVVRSYCTFGFGTNAVYKDYFLWVGLSRIMCLAAVLQSDNFLLYIIWCIFVDGTSSGEYEGASPLYLKR